VGDAGDVGVAVQIVGDAGQGLYARNAGGDEPPIDRHTDVRGGDRVVFYEDGKAAAGGKEANAGVGLAAVGFKEQGVLIGRGAAERRAAAQINVARRIRILGPEKTGRKVAQEFVRRVAPEEEILKELDAVQGAV